MVRAGESPVADLTVERSRPCVFAHMASQLIGAGKPPPTRFPSAQVGLLSCSKLNHHSFLSLLLQEQKNEN